MTIKLFKTFLITYLVLTLTACGFHLRGSQGLPPILRILYVLAQPYAPLTLQLKLTLRSAGITVVNDPKNAPLTLQIIHEQFYQHLVNISANTQVAAYNLQYVVTIQLLNAKGNTIYGPINVQTNSSFASSDTQIMADNSQLRAQQSLMRQEVIGLIFNRLNSMNVRNAIENNTK